MIYEMIKQALIHQVGIEENLINPASYLQRDLELDSTETVIIALEMKKHFKVDYIFPEEDVTLRELSEKIEALISVAV